MKRAYAGHHHAMFRVGGYYFKGDKGLEQDKVEGIKWYHLAAEAGSSSAAHYLGGFYMKGDGVGQDVDKALEYFQKAADLVASNRLI